MPTTAPSPSRAAIQLLLAVALWAALASTFGAFVEKGLRAAAAAERYAGGGFFIVPRGAAEGSDALLPTSSLAKARLLAPGVAGVAAELSFRVGGGRSVADGARVVGVELAREEGEAAVGRVPIVEGRSLKLGERGRVLLGFDIARASGVGTGDSIRLRGRGFEIVGVAAPGYFADRAFIDIEDARALLIVTDPFLARLFKRSTDAVTCLRCHNTQTHEMAEAAKNSMVFEADSLATRGVASLVGRTTSDRARTRVALEKAVPEARVVEPGSVGGPGALVAGSGALILILLFVALVEPRLRPATTVPEAPFLFTPGPAAVVGLGGGALGYIAASGVLDLLSLSVNDYRLHAFLFTPALLLLSLLVPAVGAGALARLRRL